MWNGWHSYLELRGCTQTCTAYLIGPKCYKYTLWCISLCITHVGNAGGGHALRSVQDPSSCVHCDLPVCSPSISRVSHVIATVYISIGVISRICWGPTSDCKLVFRDNLTIFGFHHGRDPGGLWWPETRGKCPSSLLFGCGGSFKGIWHFEVDRACMVDHTGFPGSGYHCLPSPTTGFDQMRRAPEGLQMNMV